MIRTVRMNWAKITQDGLEKVCLAFCCLITLLPQSPQPKLVLGKTADEKVSRSLRTEKFLYIRNFSPAGWTGVESPVAEDPQTPGEALYDLVKDPEQLSNLAGARKYSDDRTRLSDQMTNQLREAGDSIFQRDHHATFLVHGWTIHLHDQLWRDNPGETKKMLSLLAVQLRRVVNVVPAGALGRLKSVPIWINPAYEGVRPTAEFHPNARWLRDNGRDVAMEKSVELTNVMVFEFEDTRMPMLMLHELAHAYHNLVLGFRHPKIRAAFEAAKESGRYDEVKRFTGRKIVNDKAYAMSNDREYFAESTEAYFGKNDFFPFTRDELKKHDPKIHNLLTELWEQ